MTLPPSETTKGRTRSPNHPLSFQGQVADDAVVNSWTHRVQGLALSEQWTSRKFIIRPLGKATQNKKNQVAQEGTTTFDCDSDVLGLARTRLSEKHIHALC